MLKEKINVSSEISATIWKFFSVEKVVQLQIAFQDGIHV